jgi:diguanylate cyclase (GGDEF)-like protein/PAS domain S-box-containing protein
MAMTSQALCAAVFSGRSRFALVVTDPAGYLISCNHAADMLFGVHDGLIGSEIASIFTSRQRRAGLPYREMQTALSRTNTTETRLYRHIRTGHETWIEGDLSALFDDAGAHIGFIRIAQDVHARYVNDDVVRREAGIDQLTRLLNRRSFHEKLDHYVVKNTRANSFVILHLIDLDFFKQVNDTLGHEAGDAVLHEIAARLKSATRESDHVGRLGGDEFAVLQTGANSLIDGSYLAAKLVELCRQPIYLPNHEVVLSVSIGIATAPDDSCMVDELLRKADLALYRVKSLGRNNYCYFTQSLDDHAKLHAARMAALREALQTRQFHLVYQPIMSTHDGSVDRAEALLRCDHSVLKGAPIDEVLMLLRHSGNMFELSQWIIAQACSDVSDWLIQGHGPLQVSINLCARELSTVDIVPVIEAALRNHGLSPKNLSVELTEHDILDSKGTGLEVIKALRRMGISISLDDFGTGFASMEYLASLPIDILKLDRAFIEELPDDQVSAKIVSAMIGLAHSLGMRVVAEGVESPNQRDYLIKRHCDELQGYLISAPLNAAGFSKFRFECAKCVAG